MRCAWALIDYVKVVIESAETLNTKDGKQSGRACAIEGWETEIRQSACVELHDLPISQIVGSALLD